MLFLPLFQLSIKKNIPNTITLGNLLCGCLAIIKVFEGDLVWASYLVGIAAVCDFFDGFAARLLKVSSPIGKDLDSLADMVTFGVVPGLVIFQIIHVSVFNTYFFSKSLPDNPIGGVDDFGPKYLNYLPYVALAIPVFSCIRLAVFNNDVRQSDSFIGLPTPGNAILICSLPIILNLGPFLRQDQFAEIFSQPLLSTRLLIAYSLISAFLLVIPIPLFALKFKNFKWKGNEIRFIFLIWSVLLLALLQFTGIPLAILSYILFSLVNNLLKKSQSNPDANH
jgi:CDP-diacylglycerol--serine O-phosphatidyltransferase